MKKDQKELYLRNQKGQIGPWTRNLMKKQIRTSKKAQIHQNLEKMSVNIDKGPVLDHGQMSAAIGIGDRGLQERTREIIATIETEIIGEEGTAEVLLIPGNTKVIEEMTGTIMIEGTIAETEMVIKGENIVEN